MKKSVIFLAGMMVTMIAAGQNQRMVEEITVTPPKFSAGETLIQGRYFATVDDYLMQTVQYPQEALANTIRGTEVVRFVVTSEGKVNGFTVINSVCPEMDEEVIRMLQMTDGLWQPGSVNGEPSAMEQEVSVTFKLHPSDDFVAMAKDYLQHGNENLLKSKIRRALKYYDRAVNLLPDEEALLAVRGLCRYRCGDKAGAEADCNRLKSQGYFDDQNTEDSFADCSSEELKNYAQAIDLK